MTDYNKMNKPTVGCCGALWKRQLCTECYVVVRPGEGDAGAAPDSISTLYYSNDYFVAGRGATYCNQRVCVTVCLSVSSHISKTTRPNFTKFSVHVTCGCGSVLF